MNTIFIGLVLWSKVAATNQIWHSTTKASKELNLHPTSNNDICPASLFYLTSYQVWTSMCELVTMKSNGENCVASVFRSKIWLETYRLGNLCNINCDCYISRIWPFSKWVWLDVLRNILEFIFCLYVSNAIEISLGILEIETYNWLNWTWLTFWQ